VYSSYGSPSLSFDPSEDEIHRPVLILRSDPPEQASPARYVSSYGNSLSRFVFQTRIVY
jgi:hypothetical protein